MIPCCQDTVNIVARTSKNRMYSVLSAVVIRLQPILFPGRQQIRFSLNENQWLDRLISRYIPLAGQYALLFSFALC